jgi:hypothetical protein
MSGRRMSNMTIKNPRPTKTWSQVAVNENTAVQEAILLAELKRRGR